MSEKRKGKKTVTALVLSAVAVALIVFVLVLTGALGGKPISALVKTVGKDVVLSDITDFYFTRSSSTYPPEFQRYRFYLENETPMFYHETREGDHWPLGEGDITVSGSRELSEGQWQEFYEYLCGGTVKKREENADAGGSGPWLYLYWKKDRGKVQEFSFESFEKQAAFEAYCIAQKEAR